MERASVALSEPGGMEVLAFTDGAAKGNPGPGGWGAVLWIGGQSVRELGGAGGATTNNRMELVAVAAALEWVAEAAGGSDVQVTVLTDSSYVMKGLTQWLPAWKKRGWKTAAGGDVANRDLWERLEAAVASCARVGWRLVPGHAGIVGNERADEIASACATGRDPGLYEGPYAEYSLRLDLERAAARREAPDAKRAAKSRAKSAAHSYVSLVDGEARRHATWPDCERRVKGRPGARFRRTESEADEREVLRQWGARLDDPLSGR